MMRIEGKNIEVTLVDVGGSSFSDLTTTVENYARNGKIHVFMVPDEDSLFFAFGYMDQPNYTRVQKEMIVFLVNKIDQTPGFIERVKKELDERHRDDILAFEVSLKDV